MTAHPRYEGLLALRNLWSQAIFSKHLAVGLMLLAGVYQTAVVQPARTCAMLRIQRKATADRTEISSLARRKRTWLHINVTLSLIVLLLTALARTA